MRLSTDERQRHGVRDRGRFQGLRLTDDGLVVAAAVRRAEDDAHVRLLDAGIDDHRSLVEVGPIVAVYHRTAPSGPARWAATVGDRAVTLHAPSGRALRYDFGQGHRLVRLALAVDKEETTWLLLDDALQIVAWLFGVPKGEPWAKDPARVARSARALGLA